MYVYMPGAHEGQKTASNSLERELQAIVISQEGAGNWTQYSTRLPVGLSTELSLQPIFSVLYLFFFFFDFFVELALLQGLLTKFC